MRNPQKCLKYDCNKYFFSCWGKEGKIRAIVWRFCGLFVKWKNGSKVNFTARFTRSTIPQTSRKFTSDNSNRKFFIKRKNNSSENIKFHSSNNLMGKHEFIFFTRREMESLRCSFFPFLFAIKLEAPVKVGRGLRKIH